MSGVRRSVKIENSITTPMANPLINMSGNICSKPRAVTSQ